MSEELETGENGKPRLPVLDGWFTLDSNSPRLLGSQCEVCGTYYFPKHDLYCKNPACESEQFKEVELSRTGKLWSFTNASYQPPEPYVAADPFVPFAIAAVELEKEKMIVLGQVVSDVALDDLAVGMQMELVLDTLSEDESSQKIVWKWRPVATGELSEGGVGHVK